MTPPPCPSRRKSAARPAPSRSRRWAASSPCADRRTGSSPAPRPGRDRARPTGRSPRRPCRPWPAARRSAPCRGCPRGDMSRHPGARHRCRCSRGSPCPTCRWRRRSRASRRAPSRTPRAGHCPGRCRGARADGGNPPPCRPHCGGHRRRARLRRPGAGRRVGGTMHVLTEDRPRWRPPHGPPRPRSGASRMD